MGFYPDDPKKLKAKIRRYERLLKNDHMDDSYGKRYLLGPMYLLLGDVEGALKSYEWFEKTYSDDCGEPHQYLCWALALYKKGDYRNAALKLRQTMFMNLYLIPHVLGIEGESYSLRHHSNLEWKSYAQMIPEELIELWNEPALSWARKFYESPEMKEDRRKFVELEKQLEKENDREKRRKLIEWIGRFKDTAPNVVIHPETS